MKMKVIVKRLWTIDYGLWTVSRYRIISMSAPGMAAADAFYGEPKTFEYAVFFKRLQAIMRACWSKTAFGTK